MDNVLAGLTWDVCLVYLDNIIVHGKTFAEHLENLRKVFGCLREANLKLSPAKCSVF
jgi:predicted RNase H-like HicB family nuclease